MWQQSVLRNILKSSSVAARAVAGIGVMMALTACGTAPVQPESGTPVRAADSAQVANDGDPLEGLNRAIYQFNDKLDQYLLKPVAKGYRAVTPDFARQGVSNFFGNLHDPVIMVNNLLQGKFGRATSDFGRFLINSTLGIYGLIDIASHVGIEKHDEDFGQTLAVWGVGEGPYLVLPVLGPSNLRDTAGLAPDWALYPPNHMEQRSTWDKVMALEIINRRSQLLDASDVLEQAAGQDPYVFVREAYRQRRVSQIYDGEPPATPPDPSLFEDDPPKPRADTQKPAN